MYTILHDVTILATSNEVFQAISEPKELENWWPLKCATDNMNPTTYNFYFTEEYDWFGLVSKYIENQSLHIKMTQSDADWAPTTFGFDLEEKGNTTLLQFHHKGWQSTNHHYRRTSYCWAILLNGLKRYIEEGRIIPFEQRA